ncbi:hypothetical protein ACJJIP_07780 [Microbulbifer sp. VTAC004]|uniref:hypothetical protein n=1 Tax=unclassified Microbulbifer TaxID=2619833 RepID=UPI0040394AF1
MSRKTPEHGEFFCGGCSKWKAQDLFPIRLSPCGRASRCKRCKADYRRDYRVRQASRSNIAALLQRRTHQFF